MLPHPGKRSAFTLVEALIAVTMTLVIMLALAQGFKQMSNDISEGRARLALSDQLRGVSELLRNDLAGLTVVTDPESKEVKNGYFMYYEGPLADHHPVTCPVNNKLGVTGATIEENLSASRYGDFDDILMFTAQAKGDWFRGRVPLALVKGAGGPYTPSVSDWINTVVVASEYAEIVWFMMPEVQPTANTVSASPDYLYQTNADLSLPHYDLDVPVNQGTAVAPFTSGNPTNGNFVPDRMRLCRRVLLILPTLNTAGGTLFNVASASGETADVRLQCTAISNSDLAHVAMRHAYQRCDLSVHRQRGTVTAPAAIVANSLSDLANPANRFAHVMLPDSAVNLGGSDSTMPILSLTGPIPIQCFATAGNVTYPINYSNSALPSTRGDLNYIEVGFLNPAFLKRRIDSDPANLGIIHSEQSDVLGGTVEILTNEEVVANNCIAFDIKGFDSNASLLYHVGSDNQPGAALVDDDNNSTVDDASEFGVAGSDDLEVSPSDPGYAESVRLLVAGGVTPLRLSQFTSRQGTFTDLGWAFKRWQPTGSNSLIDVTKIPASLRETSLSAVATGGTNSSIALRKSGRNVQTAAGVSLIYQPVFDSYTDAFEKDGFRQRDVQTASGSVANVVNRGTIFENGGDWLANNPNPNLVTPPDHSDLASNGLDDDGNGLIDDYEERDSSPPILTAMPAIQAMIRVEDVTAGVIQQIAVTHDLTQ